MGPQLKFNKMSNMHLGENMAPVLIRVNRESLHFGLLVVVGSPAVDLEVNNVALGGRESAFE